VGEREKRIHHGTLKGAGGTENTEKNIAGGEKREMTGWMKNSDEADKKDKMKKKYLLVVFFSLLISSLCPLCLCG